MTRLAWALSEFLFNAGAYVRRWAKRQPLPVPAHVEGWAIVGRGRGQR